MRCLKTMKIADPDGLQPYILINASDYDPDVHQQLTTKKPKSAPTEPTTEASAPADQDEAAGVASPLEPEASPVKKTTTKTRKPTKGA